MTNTEFVHVANTKMEVWRQGKGQPLLFLHPGDGLNASSPSLDLLSKAFDVFAPSHPGFGASELPEHVSTVDDLAYIYLDFLDTHDLTDVLMVGTSLGGWIAAEIATKCTDRVAGLVLSGTLGAKFGDRTEREITDIFSVPQFEISRLLYRDQRSIDYSGYDDEQLFRLARNHETFSYLAWSPALYNPKLRSRLPRIDVPTLVLWGSEDRIVPPSYGQKFAAEIRGSEFALVSESGHYVHEDQPETFVNSINGFAAALAG